uniref:hydroxymethylbilane synthase n=1 Tax=Alexandrium monilatum TaxID=311494 RepID=A0A7S4UX61_9DINO
MQPHSRPTAESASAPLATLCCLGLLPLAQPGAAQGRTLGAFLVAAPPAGPGRAGRSQTPRAGAQRPAGRAPRAGGRRAALGPRPAPGAAALRGAAAVAAGALAVAASGAAGSAPSSSSRRRLAPLRGACGPSAVARSAVEGDGERAAPVLKLGTRGSPLALAQAYEAKRRLAEAFPELAPDGAVEIRIISTTGDQRLEISLSEIGGKGLFTRELDVALVSKEVDFCVHSTKDVPTALIPGTELCTMLPREDTRDVLISRDGGIARIEDFPDGSVIGTASLRRQAQIYAKNPNLKCVNFRGNVQTRLRKLKAGDVDGTLLAYAGLRRMSMEEHATRVLEWEEMLPAISQGAISFQCRSDDERTLAFLRPLSHGPTAQAVHCERAFLAALDGNCKTPIAGQARVDEAGALRFQGLVASPDGRRIFRVARSGSAAEAEALGRDAGLEVRAEAGEAFFEEMQAYVQEVQAANTRPAAALPAGA